MAANESYRHEFASAEAADYYDKVVFSPSSYGTLLWKREQKILDQVLEGLPIPTADVAALDFACGSGRVVAYLESRARMVVGVDVSKDMIDVARTRVSTATLICGDIATGARADFPEPLHTTKYDLITAFRFFTNAEPDLRRSAMLALAQMLKSADSRLVFTVQAHVPSHKSLSRLGRRAQARLTHGAVGAAYMTEREVVDLVESANLVIDRVVGYDLFSGLALKVLPSSTVERMERVASGFKGISRLGGHRLYSARMS